MAPAPATAPTWERMADILHFYIYYILDSIPYFGTSSVTNSGSGSYLRADDDPLAVVGEGFVVGGGRAAAVAGGPED